VTPLGSEKGTALMASDTRPCPKPSRNGDGLHPAWVAFHRFCGQLQHGEIERLKIQDGLPVLAEVTKQKVKFT
jgi:hypothetical protein